MQDSSSQSSRAEASEESADPQGSGLAGLIASVLRGIPGGRVLDVATGEGDFVGVLGRELANCAHITGVDRDLGSLIKAREATREDDVTFCQMDAVHLGFGDGAFDTVNISASLHHLENPGKVLQEMARVTKPGGTLIVEEMHRDGQTDAQCLAVEIHHWAAGVDRALGVPHFPTLGRQELVDLFETMSLEEAVYHDWSAVNGDPREKGLSEGVTKYMNRRLQQAQGHPQYGALAAQGDVLKRKLNRVGIQSEPVLVVVGKKGT